MVLRQTEELKQFIKHHGAQIVGIGDLSMYKLDEDPPIDKSFFEKFKFGISVGVKLDDEIVEQIDNKPTVDYADLYREVNKKLDILAGNIKDWIQKRGYIAHIIPASKIVNEKDLKGEISHKTVARIAGVGWQGKSLLIINPNYGPRFRMVTLLTNMDLEADKPIKNRCGSCEACKISCPASAIKGVRLVDRDYYKFRGEAVDLEKCFKKLLEFKTMEGINATVCGVCVKVCPWGRKVGKK